MTDGFRGHVEECVKHLAARIMEVCPRGTSAFTEIKRPIAEFCGVSIQTATDWIFRSSHLPRGEQYIKLMCFLDLNGYKVIELERMPPKCRNFAKLIGFGLVKSEDAVEMLGYHQVSELFRVLRGEGGISPAREEKLWDMWKARKDKLDEVIEKAEMRFRINLSRSESQGAEDVSASKPSNSNFSDCPRDGVVDIMQGLLKLLDSGVLQNLTDADWAALRNSSSTVLRLSSHLSTLSAKLVKPS